MMSAMLNTFWRPASYAQINIKIHYYGLVVKRDGGIAELLELKIERF